MNKNAFRILAVLTVCLLLVLALAACDVIGNCEHTVGEWTVESPPTCAANGMRVKKCAECGEEVERETLPKLAEHTHGDWIIDSPASCAEEGLKHNICSVCGVTVDRQSVEKLPHTPAAPVIENYSAPSCTIGATYDEVVYCSAVGCGAELSRTYKVSGTAEHDPGSWNMTVAPSCVSLGSEYLACRLCPAVIEVRDIPMLTEHTPAAPLRENEIDPTCTVGGSYDEVVYCSVVGCGAELSRTPIYLDPDGHTPAEPIREGFIDSTCIAEGSYDIVVICAISECGTELSRESFTVSIKEHTPAAAVIENTLDSSCTAEGSYDEVVYCSYTLCGIELSRTSKPIAIKSHTESGWITDTDPTCSAEGKRHTECTVCGAAMNSDNIPTLTYHVGGETVYENAAAPTCTSLGTRDEVAYCIWCSTELSRERVYTPKVSHTYVSGKCSICGVEENASSGLVFTSNGDGTAYVSSLGECSELAVIIPSVSPDGDKVVGIGMNAFKDTEVTSVYIPDSVTYIDASAFSGCAYLTEINIPASVTELGVSVFSGCTALYDIEGGVYYVDNWAVGSDISIVTADIREGTVGIGVYAFLRRSSLTTLHLPTGLKYIMFGAFEECTKLVAVNIPVGVAVIPENAFINCYALAELSLPEGLIGIDRNAFASCVALTELSLPRSLEYVGTSAFLNCQSFTSLTIPDSVTSIGAGTFGNCTSMATLHIGSGLSDVNTAGLQNPFYGATSLLTITVSEDNEKLLTIDGNLYLRVNGDIALVCYALASPETEFAVPDEVVIIWSQAVSWAGNLQNLSIPGPITTWISDAAFSNCRQLKIVTIGNGVKHIGEGAFQYCVALTTVSIGESVEYIGNNCFNRTNLSSASFATLQYWECINYYNPATTVRPEASDLRNTSTAAKYLKTTYAGYIWRR